MTSRIIGILHSLLFPRTGPVEFREPGAFVSLVQSLLVTLVAILEEDFSNPEAATLRDLISQLRSGKCGSLASYLADAQVDGVSVMLDGVDEAEFRDTLTSEAVVRCCKHSPSWFKDQIADHILQVNFLSSSIISYKVMTGLLEASVTINTLRSSSRGHSHAKAFGIWRCAGRPRLYSFPVLDGSYSLHP